MLLIAFGLSLLVIVAGMKLLIHTQKETLGNLYKYISLFVVVMGFLMLFAVVCGSVCRICFRGERMMQSRYGMMEGRHHGFSYEGEMEGNCCKMMGNHRGRMDECCEEMMKGNKHHDFEMEGNCCKKEKECSEGEEEECHKGKGEHEMEGCSMKKEAEFTKDSLKKNRHHPHSK